MGCGKTLAAAAVMGGLLLPTRLMAHPHGGAEQQAHLSVGPREIVVTYLIAVSGRDGEHMFDHIDANDDGQLSYGERAAFANELITNSRLVVDGRRSGLKLTHFAFPSRKDIASGNEVVRVRTRAAHKLMHSENHRLAFTVKHGRFARRWFIQPFYHADLLRSRKPPIVHRAASSSAVTILI